ncbi:hypothetical protein A1D25_09755 [Ursidibacter arcticus]|uniref:surface lipoprotein assembly modifier n=1 Tax=Ursidibacter arcticus TaxID=1524965 RepID=UPI0012FB717A|nr:surface lipoprotein assembly modifier [Ursidibacter arcticus]KAE9531717.1 hypothetical protein A1D25_09755 [Ursidibacter arcticus]
MKKYLLPLLCLPTALNATPNETEQHLHNVAKPTAPQSSPVLPAESATKPVIEINEQQLKQNPQLTHKLLSDALFARNQEAIRVLLEIYQTQPNTDPILIDFAQGKLASLDNDNATAIRFYRKILAQHSDLNAVRIELAISLFNAQQNNAAEDQFNKAKSVENLPIPIAQLIDAYLAALKKRSSWQFGATAYYIKDDNVNNASHSPEIENTGFVKGKGLLPKKANGVAYSADLSRDFNIVNAHYLAFENNLYGKLYWDSRDNDEITNRTLLGYAYKTEKSTFRLLPFFEKRWLSNARDRNTQGIRTEFNHWLSPNWQISTAMEYGKHRYYDNPLQNGHSKLVSATLLWLTKPQQFFYLGGDFNRDTTQVRQYSSDTKSLRFGWGQEWQLWGLSSRLNLSYSQRQYKDVAVLGGFLNLRKIRQDNVLSSSLTLWKRDWHLFGITPKLQFSWRKNRSNLSTLYSYTDKNINLIFETRF